jgi:hypothetical protein
MNRTVTALYSTRAQAEQARDALKAAHLGDHVDIHDQSGSDAGGAHGHGGFLEKLRGLFGGHEDRHVYGEGLRRGHFLLTAKVDDLNEIRAAEILDATEPVDLDQARETWRGEAGAPLAPAAASPAVAGADAATVRAVDGIESPAVRVYAHDG